jgi:hypothetical protein
LIGPRRVPEAGNPDNPAKDDPTREAFGIACGLLSGFGGFLSRGFRDHDFQLGRRNCQHFLSDTFALPANSETFPREWVEAYGNRAEYQTANPAKDGTRWLRIIPLVGEAAKEVPNPAWPRLSQKEFDTLLNRIGIRFVNVVKALLAQNLADYVWIASLIAARVVKPRVLTAVQFYILGDLVRRDQIKEWTLPAEWSDARNVRAVLAELLSPAGAFRQVPGIAAGTGLADAEVEDILKRCIAVPEGKPYKVWKAPWSDKATKQPVYALARRKPSLVVQWRNQLFGTTAPA